MPVASVAGRTPLMYCHRFPGCRLEGALMDGAARQSGFRLVPPVRPGYGESDALPGRELLDGPADLAALADHLGFGRFHLLGVSGGLPEHLIAVGLIAPLGPLFEPCLMKAMHQPSRMILEMASRFPPAAHRLFRHVLGPTYRHHPERLLRSQRRLSPGADARTLARPRWKRPWALKAALRRGPEGLLEDVRIDVARWRFGLAGISLPVMIWHGLEDTVVPPGHSRYLADRLPGASVQFRPGEGHFSLPLHHGPALLRRLSACGTHGPAPADGAPPQ